MKRRGALADCIPCQDRKTKLLKILRRRSAWKCKCPRVKNHYEKFHGIKFPRRHWFVAAWFRTLQGGHPEPSCPLKPRVAGEERWEGQNEGVTKEDMEFLLKSLGQW